jgi:excisionase family DNA binding protein
MPTSTAREVEQSEVVLLTVDDVCGRLRQSRRTVYKLIGTGELPSLTLGASRRIPSSALNAYIASLIARSSGAAEEVRAA